LARDPSLPPPLTFKNHEMGESLELAQERDPELDYCAPPSSHPERKDLSKSYQQQQWVWDAVRALREKNQDIECSTGYGYTITGGKAKATFTFLQDRLVRIDAELLDNARQGENHMLVQIFTEKYGPPVRSGPEQVDVGRNTRSGRKIDIRDRYLLTWKHNGTVSMRYIQDHSISLRFESPEFAQQDARAESQVSALLDKLEMEAARQEGAQREKNRNDI